MATIVGIGEILWDLIGDERKLGGAPANFSFHAHQLGHRAFPVTRVGNDPLGREINDRLRQFGLDTDYVQIDPAKPTGTVPVRVDAAGSPTFTIVEDVAWDYLDGTDPRWGTLLDADLICFGTLAQRSPTSRGAIQDLLRRSRAKKLFDINLRAPHWSIPLIRENLPVSDILKLSDSELDSLQEGRLVEGPSDPVEYCRVLIRRFDLELVCITRGAAGSLLVGRNGVADHPGIRVTVCDAVGAGDAFSAGVADGWLRGMNLAQISDRANRLGAFVASQAGATPTFPPDLLAEA
jgi:fructokinase